MSKIEKYTSIAIAIANDNHHGYSQQNRWGPDYDCSSMVITCLQAAGIPAKDLGATFTGNMRDVLLSCGFKNVTASCNLVNGAGMQRGDVLLNDARHTAIYIGNGQLVHARSSEGNSIQGDQSGNEIRVQPYYNCPWDCVLRYMGEDGEAETGDPVADPGNAIQPPKPTEDAQQYYTLRLPVLRRGSTGAAVIAAQFQLMGQGYNIGPDGADGEYGGNTAEAVKELQLNVGLTPDGVVGPQTGARLFGGEAVKNAPAAAPPDPEEAATDPTLWERIKTKLRRGTS